MTCKKVGTMIRKLREQRGLSQRDLADKAKVTGAYIAQLETGVKENPSFDVLKRIAKALKVKMGRLLD